MLRVNNLVGFGAGGSPPAAATFILGDNSSANWPRTYSDVVFPADGIAVVFAIPQEGATGVSIGGNAMTAVPNTLGPNNRNMFWYRAITAGTYDIAGSGSSDYAGLVVWLLTRTLSSAPIDSDYVPIATTTSVSKTMTLLKGSVALYGILVGSGVSVTWSGATSDYSTSTGSGLRVSGATYLATAAGDHEAGATFSSNPFRFACCAFR